MGRAIVSAIMILVSFSLLTPAPTAAGDLDHVTFLSYFDAQLAWNSIEHLAGDQFDGRKAGTEGAELASEYIANYFDSIGLKPAGSAGSYRTQFNMPLWNLAQIPSLALVDTAGNSLQAFQYRREFYVQQGSGGGEYSAEVIFAGYGISAPSLGYDDYADITVRGKIILAIIGTPPSDRLEDDDYGSWPSKAQNAVDHGAVGLILVDSPAAPTPHYIERWSGGRTIYSKLAILRGSIGMADTLLNDTGMTLSSIQQTINQQLKPKSLALGKQLRVSIAVDFTDNANAYNVLGFIPGFDLSSKKVVIIGGHYDHLGKDVDGSIFHGANDNGSGVAVMMEIARIFAAAVRPKLSILFAAWSGEEEGLYGSSAYVNNPHFPLRGTVAYLNLDMVGAGSALTAEISETHTALRGVMDESAKLLGFSLKVEGFSGGSDHVPFERSKVQNLMFIYIPLDEVYHTPADTTDHISKSKLLETGRLTALIALKLAEATVSIMTLTPPATQVSYTTTNVLTESENVSTSIKTTESQTTTASPCQLITWLLGVEIIMVVGIALTALFTAGIYLRKRR